MPRATGTPKTGGRKKGTPNGRTGELVDQLADSGLDVVSEIAKALPELEAETRVETLMELMGFLFPKRKAIEHSGQLETAVPPGQSNEIASKSLGELRAESLKITERFIKSDAAHTMLAIKTLVRMKSTYRLPPEGRALLEKTFGALIDRKKFTLLLWGRNSPCNWIA